MHEDHVLKLKVLITPLACLLCLACGTALAESLKNYTPATHEVPDRTQNEAVTQATDAAVSEDSALASTPASDNAASYDSAQTPGEAATQASDDSFAETFDDTSELLANFGELPGLSRGRLTYPGIYLPEGILTTATEALLTAEDEAIALAAAGLEGGADLWLRMRAGFKLEPDNRKAVQQQLDWYVDHPAYLTRVFTRAQRYLPYIVAEAESRGMPLEVALLPVVESAFDPFAYSHGRAAGLWQIIPGTGKRFGLKQNWWYDGRRDPVAATRAALDYLEYLHGILGGDWLLAVAAYNSGEGNVMRAQKANIKRSRDTDFWSLSLPRETEAYVPKLLAIRAVVADPESLGLVLPPMVDAPYFEEVETGSQIDLALAADLAGVDIDELYSLNAGFNRWATDPDGPHRLMVPVDAAPVLSQALADLPARERVQWVRYKVKNGDALGNIAAKNRTTVEVLREVNDLKGSMIRAGSYLMIPTATRSLDNYSKSADARLSHTQAQPRGVSKTEHRVRSGESFWSIGRKYGVSTRDLAKWNGMAPGDTLGAGKTLVVWTGSTPVQVGSSPSNQVRKVTYTVRQGDSLARISSRFRVSVGEIQKWNAATLTKSKYLQPGQKLVMYVDVTAQSSGA
ncbi:MAG: LysM peptidoglycan-binding domain-containing protein [Gammaproteobacteria bacterium]|nr:LysM peptidoglycan-binding domain-containing protein [Gammaproteobacteria bacterium]